jgi:hypothetical protein
MRCSHSGGDYDPDATPRPQRSYGAWDHAYDTLDEARFLGERVEFGGEGGPEARTAV